MAGDPMRPAESRVAMRMARLTAGGGNWLKSVSISAGMASKSCLPPIIDSCTLRDPLDGILLVGRDDGQQARAGSSTSPLPARCG